MTSGFLPRKLPTGLEVLTDLALDVRWTWSHAGDALWRMVSPDAWERTYNPWTLLQDIPGKRLEQLAQDPRFQHELQRLFATHGQYLNDPGWYQQVHAAARITQIAYFSLEFGLARIIHEQKEDERKLYSTGRHRVMNMTNSEEERKKGENYKRRQTHRGV